MGYITFLLLTAKLPSNTAFSLTTMYNSLQRVYNSHFITVVTLYSRLSI